MQTQQSLTSLCPCAADLPATDFPWDENTDKLALDFGRKWVKVRALIAALCIISCCKAGQAVSSLALQWSRHTAHNSASASLCMYGSMTLSPWAGAWRMHAGPEQRGRVCPAAITLAARQGDSAAAAAGLQACHRQQHVQWRCCSATCTFPSTARSAQVKHTLSSSFFVDVLTLLGFFV